MSQSCKQSMNEVKENNDPLDVRNKIQLDFMSVEIVDLFQRNAELLDRVISLEDKVHGLRKKANEK